MNSLNYCNLKTLYYVKSFAARGTPLPALDSENPESPKADEQPSVEEVGPLSLLTLNPSYCCGEVSMYIVPLRHISFDPNEF